MALQARNLVISRRAAAVADFSSLSIAGGSINVEACESEGVFRVNCSHQIGIATQTEVGLPAARFPIRVVLVDPAMNYSSPTVDAVCRYWSIRHADGTAVVFSRRPEVNNTCIKNLYACTAGLDTYLWGCYRANRGTGAKSGIVAAWAQETAQLYALLKTVNPTTSQMAEMGTLVNSLLTASIVVNNHAYFQVGDNAYIHAVPHGTDYTQMHSISDQRVAVYESLLTVKVNYDRMKARYETLPDGAITMAASAVMMMFRHGIAEAYESTEYYTVACSLNANGTFNVEEIHSPSGVGPPEGITAGDTIDISGVMLLKQAVEVSSLLVMSAGLMHYLFNHTTGGTVVSGTLLTTLAMFSLVTVHTHLEEQTQITSLMYEALHPVNKRAVANIFFNKSMVYTHGRSSTFRRYEQFESDAFFAIRSNPFPAGSHKAFICLTALKRVLQAGLAPFLPWADQLTTCINLCREVLTNGARGHIGSAYYTGEPPIIQPSSLDQYLPELAVYLHTFNKGDSLTMSPHMSLEIASRAAMNWQNMLKDLKARDISSTPAETVRSFLATTGGVNFTFDPDDESTWARAASDTALAQRTIASVFD